VVNPDLNIQFGGRHAVRYRTTRMNLTGIDRGAWHPFRCRRSKSKCSQI